MSNFLMLYFFIPLLFGHLRGGVFLCLGSLQVGALGGEAIRLQKRYMDSADQVAAKQAEIVGNWEGLRQKVNTANAMHIRSIEPCLSRPTEKI